MKFTYIPFFEPSVKKHLPFFSCFINKDAPYLVFPEVYFVPQHIFIQVLPKFASCLNTFSFNKVFPKICFVSNLMQYDV
jgi:hypothetical protein